MRDRGSPHGEGRAWRGHISATQMPHKYVLPSSYFSQISTPESKRKLLGRNLFRKCFKLFWPIPALYGFPSSKSSFLDDCRKSRGDHVVGLVTCSSAPISKQRVSQRTNNKHLLPSSHRVGEKQEQTRGKKGKSEPQLICQAPQSLLPPGRERESLLSRQLSRLKMWGGQNFQTFKSQDATRTEMLWAG